MSEFVIQLSIDPKSQTLLDTATRLAVAVKAARAEELAGEAEEVCDAASALLLLLVQGGLKMPGGSPESSTRV